jgi:hypothetical protein
MMIWLTQRERRASNAYHVTHPAMEAGRAVQVGYRCYLIHGKVLKIRRAEAAMQALADQMVPRRRLEPPRLAAQDETVW